MECPCETGEQDATPSPIRIPPANTGMYCYVEVRVDLRAEYRFLHLKSLAVHSSNTGPMLLTVPSTWS